jgi:uncharacterized protein (TIGR00255 family)
MTGYASGQQTAHGSTEDAPAWKNAQARLGLELRSVNSRFLDLGFRLSDELRQHEPALRELLGKRLKRGKVELRAYLQGRDAGTLADPPPRVLQRLASVQDQVRVWLPDAAPLSVADALRAASSAEPADDEGTAKALMELAQTVLDDFVAARAREGARLAKLIRERVAQLRELARAAEPLVPQAVQAQKERFIARWNEALASGDVAEELGRLAAHLDEIEAVLKKGGEVGKRLDFLIQELHREANTLGSKSAALELTRVSVDMKVLIEQMREQVQNIE